MSRQRATLPCVLSGSPAFGNCLLRGLDHDDSMFKRDEGASRAKRAHWFSFFHEADHILEGDKRDYVDPADPGEAQIDSSEREADRFARNILISPEAYAVLVSAGDFSESAIRTFADGEGVAPGIVLGRLQRDELVATSHFNNLKKSINWTAVAPAR